MVGMAYNEWPTKRVKVEAILDNNIVESLLQSACDLCCQEEIKRQATKKDGFSLLLSVSISTPAELLGATCWPLSNQPHSGGVTGMS